MRVGLGSDGMVMDEVRGINIEMERGEVMGIVGE